MHVLYNNLSTVIHDHRLPIADFGVGAAAVFVRGGGRIRGTGLGAAFGSTVSGESRTSGSFRTLRGDCRGVWGLDRSVGVLVA